LNVYWDSSILLALAMEESHQLVDWRSHECRIGSELVRVECFRSLDRIQLAGRSTPEKLLKARENLFALLAVLDVVPIHGEILRRASDPFPLPVRTLDAIHLSTAIAWRDRYEQEVVFATHDKTLGKAAAAVGFTVVGV
jgi:predicted nucleic acid-binding protein